MALAKTVYDLSKKAFDLVGDLKTPAIYTRKGTTTYDPLTDTMTSTDTVLNMEVVVVKNEAVEREAAKVTFYSKKIIAHSSSFGTLVPRETDLVSLQGVNYKVNGVESPPSSPIYTLMLVRV
jgi:PKD repeat protein